VVSVADIYASAFSATSFVLPRVSIIKFKASTCPSSGRHGVIYKTGKGSRLLPSIVQEFHVTGIAAVCWAIWKAQNKTCFEGKMIQNPISIICHACALICYWAGLFLEGDKEMLIEGAHTMLQITLKLLNKKQKPHGCQELEDEDTHNQQD
jgi:hypothetical protein